MENQLLNYQQKHNREQQTRLLKQKQRIRKNPQHPNMAARSDVTLVISQIDGMPAPNLNDLSEGFSQSSTARTTSTLTTLIMGTPSRPKLSPSCQYSPSTHALANYTSLTQSPGKLS